MIKTWHNWLKNHLLLVNSLVIIGVLAMGFKLQHLQFNADWLALFSQNDPKVVSYQNLVGNRDTSAVYLKVNNKEATGLIRKQSGISAVTPVVKQWLRVDFDPQLSQPDQQQALTKLKQNLKSKGVKFEATGALEIFNQFNQSVQSDFNLTTLIAAGLIILIMLWFYGLNPIILYGFFLQLLGIVSGLFIYSFFFNDINLITATIPCVLLGLGIDFSIHVATICAEEEENPGLVVYDRVAKPLFWGVVSTSLAFFTLCFNDLTGLVPTGVLGGISLFTMYAFVILLLPAFASRFSGSRTKRIKKFRLPLFKSALPHSLLWIITATVIILSIYAIPNLRFEDNTNNLYDPKLPALLSQQELNDDLGINPTPLFITLEKAPTPSQINQLQQAQLFQLIPTKVPQLNLAIFAKSNPFDRSNFKALETEITSIIGDQFSITGAPTICHHLNNLLLDGMAKASIAVFTFVFFLIWFMTKRLKVALAVGFILLLSTAGTLTLMSLLGLKLSTYTMILIPMLLGIGVDDCLHIVFQHHLTGQSIKNDDHIIKAITLTTLTTAIGYGALVIAKNQGFISMGLVAIIGLTVFFQLTLYFLPTLITRKRQ